MTKCKDFKRQKWAAKKQPRKLAATHHILNKRWQNVKDVEGRDWTAKTFGRSLSEFEKTFAKCPKCQTSSRRQQKTWQNIAHSRTRMQKVRIIDTEIHIL